MGDGEATLLSSPDAVGHGGHTPSHTRASLYGTQHSAGGGPGRAGLRKFRERTLRTPSQARRFTVCRGSPHSPWSLLGDQSERRSRGHCQAPGPGACAPCPLLSAEGALLSSHTRSQVRFSRSLSVSSTRAHPWVPLASTPWNRAPHSAYHGADVGTCSDFSEQGHRIRDIRASRSGSEPLTILRRPGGPPGH